MKIAFISMIREPWGGSEELWAETAKEALQAGHTVYHSSFYCGSIHPKSADLYNKGVIPFFRRGFIRPGTSAIKKFMRQVLNFLKNKIENPFHKLFRQRPDIVVYTGTAYSIASEKHLFRYLEDRSIQFFIIAQLNTENKNELSPGQIERVKKYYDRCTKVFFVSNRNKQMAEENLGAIIQNAIVVKNPVNLRSTALVPYPPNPQAQFAMIGNLVLAHKGQDLVFAVLAEPQWEKRDYHLHIYGKGQDEEVMHRIVSTNRLTSRVSFHGHVTDISEIWKKNQLLLMPSRMEGMPLAIVEAMICGRATMATDVGGVKEWIVDGESGFISRSTGVQDVSAAMEKMWEAKDKWKEMGEKALDHALAQFDSHPGKTLLKMLLS